MAYNSTFPKQNIPDSEKTKDWCKNMVDAVTRYHGNSVRATRERRKDYDNYMLFNGLFDQRQFEYITNTYGLATPARLVNYPIIQPKVDLMVGEFVQQPLKYNVHTVNTEAISRKLDKRTEMVTDYVMAPIIKEIEKEIGASLGMNNDVLQQIIPDDLEDFLAKNYRENVEEMVYNGLNYLSYKYSLKDIFKRGLYDLCITGKEFYKVEIVNGDPRVRRVDPRALIYDLNSDSEYLDDAWWVAEERYMTVNEIIDEYRNYLTPDDVYKLEDIRQSTPNQLSERYSSPNSWYYKESDNDTSARIKVIMCEWKSIRQIKVKVSPNKYDPDAPFIKILPPDYKPKKSDLIETRYISDIWEATKIGPDIMIKCRRRPNQIRYERDISNTSLSYFGCVRNNIDGSTISVVDSLKNIQLLYNIVMFHIELAMARSGGKSVVYDTAQAPQGMDFSTIMYHVKNSGIIPINTQLEGNQMANFNQFSQVDFTLSNSVQQLLNLKIMLEDTADKITGINKERQGVMKGYETVGASERSVFQSSLITQPMFYIHSKLIERVLNHSANLMKICWNEKDSMSYVLGDIGVQMFNIDDTIQYSDYGVFVNTMTSESQKKRAIESLGQAALSSGQIGFLEMIKIVNAESAQSAETVLEKAIQSIKAQQQQQQQQQAELEQAKLQQEQSKMQQEMDIVNANNETKIQVAQINSGSNERVQKTKSDSEEDQLVSKNVQELDMAALMDEAKRR